MSRSQRLLDLLQRLRQYRYPVSGAVLAEELNVSLRTLYRDIATLQQQGARIEGEAGLGYVLRPGFMLPPLMFSDEEVEALALGAKWVAQRGDERLAANARAVLAKVAAVLPDDLRREVEDAALLPGPGKPLQSGDGDLSPLRQAIRQQRKLVLHYQDGEERVSVRTVWPFALGFFDQVRLLVAWCELRQDFRSFRTDRIRAAEAQDERYPQHRQALLKAWCAREGAAER